jgi:hypothetical protein
MAKTIPLNLVVGGKKYINAGYFGLKTKAKKGAASFKNKGYNTKIVKVMSVIAAEQGAPRYYLYINKK